MHPLSALWAAMDGARHPFGFTWLFVLVMIAIGLMAKGRLLLVSRQGDAAREVSGWRVRVVGLGLLAVAGVGAFHLMLGVLCCVVVLGAAFFWLRAQP